MARNNETGVVGGSTTSLHPPDTKPTAPASQKEGGICNMICCDVFSPILPV